MNLKNHKKVTDAELNISVGDPYNDGTYSGKVKEIQSDKIIVETTNENGDVADVEIPIGDACHVHDGVFNAFTANNVDQLWTDGETIVTADGADPEDILSYMEIELENYLAPGEQLPGELKYEQLEDNKLKIYFV
jgi:hypothetical protein